MSDQEHHTGITLTINKVDKTTYEIKQVNPPKMMQLNSSNHRKIIEYGHDPVSYFGYAEVETFEIGVDVAVYDISFGTVYGNLKDGIKVKVQIAAISGEINLYLKNGNELWTSYDLKRPFADDLQDDSKVSDL